MPIFVNEKTLHHACSGHILDERGRIVDTCRYFRLDVPHSEVKVIPYDTSRGLYGLALQCPSCGSIEGFNPDLHPDEEQEGHLGHQQQAAHIRRLQQHLNVPRLEERSRQT